MFFCIFCFLCFVVYYCFILFVKCHLSHSTTYACFFVKRFCCELDLISRTLAWLSNTNLVPLPTRPSRVTNSIYHIKYSSCYWCHFDLNQIIVVTIHSNIHFFSSLFMWNKFLIFLSNYLYHKTFYFQDNVLKQNILELGSISISFLLRSV